MQPYDFADNALDGHGFWNHVDSCTCQLGSLDGQPLVERYAIWLASNLQATSGGGAKPRRLLLLRKVVVGGNASPWYVVRHWVEGQDFQDAPAAGSVSVNPLTGDVYVDLSAGRTTASGVAWQPFEAVVTRGEVGPQVIWPAPPSSDARVDALITEIVTLKARIAELEARPAGGGLELTAGELEALRRMSVFFGYG